MEIALITGPSSGIGRETALEMARRGFHVVAAGRSEEKTRPVLAEIESEGGTTEYLHLDLASLDSCRRAASEFEKTDRKLDVLINNAGVGGVTGLTEDGFEKHFGVNHLGHFLLTHRLRRTFRHGTRIVVVSSAAHRRADGIDFDRVQERGSIFTSLHAYAVSKLANVLFARRLAQLQPDWNTYSVHPGLAATNIFPAIAKPFFRNRVPPDVAARTSVYCATSSEVADQSGLYYARMAVREPSASAQDDDLAVELWERSERWCGVAPQQ
jgi:retinol dehydrogenase-12